MTDRDIYKEIKVGDRGIKIYYDQSPENPRQNGDYLGTFVMWHRNYEMSDEKPDCDPQEFLEGLGKECEILPVYMMDHSGISLSTGSFGCPWDSGQVGFIYVMHEKIKKEYGDLTEETKAKAREVLEREIKEIDLYVRGEVYGFRLYELVTCAHCNHTTEEEEDSCWGFITHEPEKAIWEQLSEEDQETFKELNE